MQTAINIIVIVLAVGAVALVLKSLIEYGR